MSTFFVNCIVLVVQKRQQQLAELLKETAEEKADVLHKQEQAQRQVVVRAQQDNNVIEQLKLIVGDREARVCALELELRKLKCPPIERQQPQNPVSSFVDTH